MCTKILIYFCIFGTFCVLNHVNGAVSNEEKIKLKKLHQLTSNLVRKYFMKTDGYLIRWLRAKNLDVDAALAGIKRTIEWRSENNMDNILNEHVIEEIIRNPYYTLDGVDREGRPVLTFDIKKVNTRKYAVSGQSKIFLRHWYQILEKVEDKTFKNVNRTSGSANQQQQARVIYDAEGYNLRQQGCLRCFPIYGTFWSVLERHYPAIFATQYCINAPRIFAPLLEFLKPIMSPTTRKTFFVYGLDKNEWQPKLREIIEPGQLPANYGGNKNT